MNTLQSQLARLLGRRDKLGSDECAGELAKIADRLKEINQRSIEIDYNAGGRPGPTLRAALETGTPQQVVELQREAELLEAERDSLSAQHEALKERRQAAIAEEAVPTVRDLLRKLPGTVGRMEKLAQQLAAARSELDDMTEAFSAARRTARDGGQSPPAMDLGLFDRLMAARGRNAEARLGVLTAWTDELPPHVAESRRLDEARWDREEKERQAHAAREAKRREGNAA